MFSESFHNQLYPCMAATQFKAHMALCLYVSEKLIDPYQCNHMNSKINSEQNTRKTGNETLVYMLHAIALKSRPTH